MKKVTRSLILVSAVTFLPAAIESTPASATTPEQANLTELISKLPPERVAIPKFSCQQHDYSLSTTFGINTNSADVIGWESSYFERAGYDAKTRCLQVSNRLQQYQEDGTISNITKGYINGMPVLCIGEKPNANECRSGNDRGLVLTLHRRANASSELQKLKNDLDGAKSTYSEKIGCKAYDENLVKSLRSNGSFAKGKIQVLNNLYGTINQSAKIKLALYHSDAPSRVLNTWSYDPNEMAFLSKDNKQLNIGNDWGIQLILSNGTKSCVYPVSMVSRFDNGKFHVETTSLWQGMTPPPPPPKPIVFHLDKKNITGYNKVTMEGDATLNPNDGTYNLNLVTRRENLIAGASGKVTLTFLGENEEGKNEKNLYEVNKDCGIDTFGARVRHCDKDGQIPQEVRLKVKEVRIDAFNGEGDNIFTQGGKFVVSRGVSAAKTIYNKPLTGWMDITEDIAKSGLATAAKVLEIDHLFGHKTNKWNERGDLEKDGWTVVYLKEMDMKQYKDLGTAGVTDVFVGGGSQTLNFFINYAQESYTLLLTGISEKGSKTISDTVQKDFSPENLLSLLDKKGGSLSISGIDLDVGIAEYSRAECNPFGCVPMIPSYQPYIRYKLGIGAGW